MNTYWSNCLIEGLKRKLMSPKSVDLKFIISRHGFHVMWHDKRLNAVQHFTHKPLPGKHCDLLFRGVVETLSIEKFNAYCMKKNKPHLRIS